MRLNSETIPYIHPSEISNTDILLLDARKYDEFQVSHIPRAQWVGYKDFKIGDMASLIPDKNQKLVVYCSIGVRSEDIAEQLKQAGYTEVYNLYGGIFEWKNKGYPVVDQQGNPTEKVHPYSRYWGRFLTNAEKAYLPD